MTTKPSKRSMEQARECAAEWLDLDPEERLSISDQGDLDELTARIAILLDSVREELQASHDLKECPAYQEQLKLAHELDERNAEVACVVREEKNRCDKLRKVSNKETRDLNTGASIVCDEILRRLGLDT